MSAGPNEPWRLGELMSARDIRRDDCQVRQSKLGRSPSCGMTLRTNVRSETGRIFWFAVPIIFVIDHCPSTSNRGSLGPLAPG